MARANWKLACLVAAGRAFVDRAEVEHAAGEGAGSALVAYSGAVGPPQPGLRGAA